MRRLLRLAVLLAALPARAQEVGPAMPAAPAAIESSTPAVPIAVVDDAAQQLFRQVPPRSETPPAAAAGGQTVQVPLDPPPAVNSSRHFVLEDVTDRTAPRGKTLAERRVAVEVLRQSLRRAGGRR